MYRFAKLYLSWSRAQREDYFKKRQVVLGVGGEEGEGESEEESGEDSDEDEEDNAEEAEEEDDEDHVLDTLSISSRVAKTLKREKLTLTGLAQGMDVSRNVLSRYRGQ